MLIPQFRKLHPRSVGLCFTLLASACQVNDEYGLGEVITEEALGRVAIAGLDEALTFARYDHHGQRRVVAVTQYEGHRIQGVDLGRALGEPADDPIDLFLKHGYAAIEAAVLKAPADVDMAVEHLGIPVDLTEHHIATGTNFPEHADEAGVVGGPYLFPKLARPTAFDAPVPARRALLDYEVELAWVPLHDLKTEEAPEFVGLILCNDFSDRDVLLRNIDTRDVASGEGFTTAKSFSGFLPVGNLFVIPRDHQTFAPALELKLYVNYELRQKARVERGVWDFAEIVRQSWARANRTWDHRGQAVPLFPRGEAGIPARTMIMSGTPPGVVFNHLNVEHKASGLFDFLLFDWDDSVPDHAVDNYIRDAHALGIFLQPDDEVSIHVDRMGRLQNEVTK